MIEKESPCHHFYTKLVHFPCLAPSILILKFSHVVFHQILCPVGADEETYTLPMKAHPSTPHPHHKKKFWIVQNG